MGKVIDLVGQRFGRLVVIESAGIGADRSMRWRCLCDCGNETTTTGKALRAGATRSCGCLQKDAIRATQARTLFKHGHTIKGLQSLTYHSWQAMKQRCYNPAAAHFEDYGGRGLRVCDRWVD